MSEERDRPEETEVKVTPEMVDAFWDEFLAWKQEGDNQEALEDGESGDQVSLAERALAWAQKCFQREILSGDPAKNFL